MFLNTQLQTSLVTDLFPRNGFLSWYSGYCLQHWLSLVSVSAMWMDWYHFLGRKKKKWWEVKWKTDADDILLEHLPWQWCCFQTSNTSTQNALKMQQEGYKNVNSPLLPSLLSKCLSLCQTCKIERDLPYSPIGCNNVMRLFSRDLCLAGSVGTLI